MTIRSVSVRLPIAPVELDLLRAFASSRFDERFYWARPSLGIELLALGEVRAVEASGEHRLSDAANQIRALFEAVEVRGDAAPVDVGPLLVGGFSFADRAADPPWEAFPSVHFVLPSLLVVARPSGCWVTCSVMRTGTDTEWEPTSERVAESIQALRVRSGAEDDSAECGFERRGAAGMIRGPEYRVRSDRSHADYRAQVNAARHAIARGELEKVVLARSLRVRHDGRFDLRALLRRLSRLYPTCVTFAAARDRGCFLGATPERLIALRGDRVCTGAVAGSAPRGHSPEEDDRLGRALLESKKEQVEHAVVVRSIARALAPICDELSVPESPSLLRIEGIQHLETAIEGRLGAGSSASLLELAARLHPTPAVGGAPTPAALEWIDRCEGLDRGWYAGGIGWVDRSGGGELRVGLRSGLIRPADGNHAAAEEALLFAGGGIVADSHADRELEETRIKLRALLAPLTEI